MKVLKAIILEFVLCLHSSCHGCCKPQEELTDNILKKYGVKKSDCVDLTNTVISGKNDEMQSLTEKFLMKRFKANWNNLKMEDREKCCDIVFYNSNIEITNYFIVVDENIDELIEKIKKDYPEQKKIKVFKGGEGKDVEICTVKDVEDEKNANGKTFNEFVNIKRRVIGEQVYFKK